MEFTYLLRELLRRKWIIVLCVVVALAGAFLFTRSMEKLYSSEAQMSTGFTVTEDLKLSNENFNVAQIDFKFNNAIENITSPRVLTLVSYRLLLHDLQSGQPFKQVPDAQVRKVLNGTGKTRAIALLTAHLDSFAVLSPSKPDEEGIIKLADAYDYTAGTLAASLKVERQEKTDYINLEYKSPNPLLSAFLLNTLCSEFRSFYAFDKRQHTNLSVTSLDSAMQAKKAILDQKQLAKTQFMTSQGLLDANMEGSSKLSQISTYENELIEDKGAALDASYRVKQLDEQIKEAEANDLKYVADPDKAGPGGGSGTGNEVYVRLRKEYHDLYATYIQGGSKDADIKAKLDNISQQMTEAPLTEKSTPTATDNLITLDQLRQRLLGAKGEQQSANLKVSSIQEMLTRLYGGMSEMAAKETSVQQYDRDIQNALAEYNVAKEQYDLAANMNEALPGAFKQTLLAEAALSPDPSKRFIIIAAAGIVALILSSLAIVFRAFFDHSYKTPTQFQQLTHLQLLGSVEKVKITGDDPIVVLMNGGAGRRNMFKEQLRKLRFEIEKGGWKVVLFTSTESGEGKTTLIRSLAYSLSIMNKKVLLLDTNFSNNELTRVLNGTPSLQHIRPAFGALRQEILEKSIVGTVMPGVDIIGSEPGDYTPSEVFSGHQFQDCLDYLKKKYDYIFLEGASLNRYTDTKELVPFADSVIAVFSAESFLKAADKEAISYLDHMNGKFSGSILNKVSKDNMDL